MPGNEIGSITGGTGGEVGPGISFDDVTKMLTINVGWGSGQGFTDLAGTVTAAHIHGAATQTQNAGVLVGLGGITTSATNGGIVTTLSAAAFEANLLNGLTYINVHTTANSGGEMRGNLIAIPEPSTLVLIAGAGSALVVYRRKQRR